MNRLSWNPSVEVDSYNGIRELSVYTRHLSKRRIFLNGEINSEMANDIVAQLLFLQEESEEPIHIYINSGGGEINAGLFIYDVIQSITVPVYMYCTGMAASMAAVLLAGGQPGRRFILPHSKTMIHEPLLSGGVGGSATSIRNISDSILETRSIVNGILAKHTGKTLKEINKATSFDNYMNAEKSVEFGICDKVVQGLLETA
ncbi:MAG: ATP-dependent Clp protease proteolytic subunit [Lachnospiraceae bacterium]|nr:ATP-dependent Clp protease proteolytic subunit [Lachnospiraceae bacterium]